MRVLFLSYGDVIPESGYKTRIYGEMASLSTDVDIFFIGFERRKHLKRVNNGETEWGLGTICRRATLFTRYDFIPLFFLSMIFLTVYGYYWILKYKIQLIHGQNYYSTFLALLLKPVTKVKVIFDVHGLVPEEYQYLRNKGANSMTLKLLRWIERCCVFHSDRLLCVSAKLKMELANRYPSEAVKMTVLPSCVNTEVFKYDHSEGTSLRSTLSFDDNLIVAYIGNLMDWAQLDDVINTWRIIAMNDPSARFLVVTQNDLEQVRSYFFDQGFKKGEFALFTCPHDKVPAYLSASDIGLVIRSNSVFNRIASPTKVAEYLACGVPLVISPEVGDWSGLIEEQGVGITLDGRGDREWKHKIANFLSSLKNNRSEIKKRCRQLVAQQFSHIQQRKRLLEIYEDLSGNNC